ncbi:hypothetical protein IMG5_203400 [Ichthyophthirius multifiliis]|uniref:Uncharacterized protein n=1 Tax=Ichthyophthirius multifiliis TaxID=5932 RepID=G0R6A3_ICHMU|nr:hypothetical protein IMG5_203400 [Ichthyophthirius multifiliis]EGR27000.1 hypothetical protein IMG5_203400 [Ichthyophthirius multifiliis]|eukprot:XP_004023884.1 hypothetical protein IMG5_203400 [Ichthyophthirius multifiliis]
MQLLQGGFIPSWIQHKPAEKYLRIVWRFFLQSFMMIPFMLYEKRTGNETAKQQYKFSHMFNWYNLKQAYLSSIPTSIWFTLILFTFEWNFVAHAAILGNLSNFYNCINRNLAVGVTNPSDISSIGLILLGILMILYDSYSLQFEDIYPSSLNYKMNKLFYREPWQRLLFGNFISLFASFVTFKMQPNASLALKVYQPYQATFFICIFNCLNISMSSYFFSGSDILSGSSMWGLLGLFSSEQFSGFLFMSIVIGMGGFITSQLTSKMFEQPLLQTFQLFEPIVSALVLQLLDVQIIPRGISCIAFLFIISGLFGIITGQYFAKLQIQ